MGPPIVDFGFSEEFKENVFGIHEDKGVEVTVPGMVDFMEQLAGLGLDDFVEAHGTLLDSLETVWDHFIENSSSNFAIDLGDFIRNENVKEQLLEKLTAYPGYCIDLGDPWLAAGMTAFEINLQMIEIFFNDFLPFLEQWIDNKNRDLKLHIDKAIEKLGDDDGAGGGGSYSDDDIDRVVDDAIDDFFDDLADDEFEPDDLDDLDEQFVKMSETLGDFEADLDAAQGAGGADASERIEKLRAQLALIRERLAGPRNRVQGWSRPENYFRMS